MRELESHLLTCDGRGVARKREYLEEYVRLRASLASLDGWRPSDVPDRLATPFQETEARVAAIALEQLGAVETRERIADAFMDLWHEVTLVAFSLPPAPASTENTK